MKTKKILFSLIFMSLMSFQVASAQICQPDPQYTQPGIYPDSATGLPCAIVNLLYDEVMTFVVPVDTAADVGGIPVDFWIDSIVLLNITGLPSGIVVGGCNPSSCGFPGGTSGCVIIIGTPTVVGFYPLEVYTRAYLTEKTFGFKVTQDDTIGYYFINVVNDLVLDTTSVTNTTSCGASDGAIDLSVIGGTGAYTYNWSPGGITTQDITGLQAGIYTVVVTDGCFSKTLSITINDTAAISGTITTTPDTNNTGVGTATVNISGGTSPYDYRWSNGDSTINTILLTDDITGLSAGTYSVTVTDANGCTFSISDTVDFVSTCNITSSFTSSTTNICEGETVNFTNTSSGATSYDWLENSVSFATTTNTTRTFGTAGSYIISLIADNGSCSDSSGVVITVNPLPPIPTITQNGGILTSSSAINYQWFLNGDTITGATSQFYTATQNGFYTVTVTNINGCTSTSDPLNVTLPCNITSSFTSSVTNICEGETVNFTNTSTGATNYDWLENGLSFATTTNTTRTFGTAGSYTISLIADNGNCSDTSDVVITINPLPTVDLGSDITICSGCSTLLDAGAGFTIYNWSTGENTQIISVNSADTYTVEVTDINGCVGIDTIVIDIASGVNEFQVSSLIFKVYPNPTKASITLYINTSYNEELSFVLYDLLGNEVKRTENIITGETKINTGDLSNAIYFYKLTNKRELLKTGKLIIN